LIPSPRPDDFPYPSEAVCLAVFQTLGTHRSVDVIPESIAGALLHDIREQPPNDFLGQLLERISLHDVTRQSVPDKRSTAVSSISKVSSAAEQLVSVVDDLLSALWVECRCQDR